MAMGRASMGNQMTGNRMGSTMRATPAKAPVAMKKGGKIDGAAKRGKTKGRTC